VSGGCIEDDLIDSVARDGVTHTIPIVVDYGISADQARQFGLPCGGTIQLAIEPLSAASRIPELLERLGRGETVERRIHLKTGEVSLHPASADSTLQVEDDVLVTVHGPRWRLFIIGAGQLSRFLAQVASAMDYRVTVCDPREEYRMGWDVPGVELVHCMPDDLVIEARLDARSAVVALTHDPKLDDLALMEALKSNASTSAPSARAPTTPSGASASSCSISPTISWRACMGRSASTSAARRRPRSRSRSWPSSPP
jgi:xanthine dehydrogenase accessory factor